MSTKETKERTPWLKGETKERTPLLQELHCHCLYRTIVGVCGAASTSSSLTVTDANRRVALLSATTFVATLKDQFGAVRSGVAVTATVTGRNAATASTLVTGSDGKVSFTVTDAGTTGTSDTVTFTATVSATGTITYGNTTATTLTLEGPNFEDTQITLSDMTGINAAKAGAAGTTA